MSRKNSGIIRDGPSKNFTSSFSYKTYRAAQHLESYILLSSKQKFSSSIQGGAGGLAVGWVDLEVECSTILLGQ